MESEAPFTSDDVRAAVAQLREETPLATEPAWCEPCPGHASTGLVWAELYAPPNRLESPFGRQLIEASATYDYRVPRGEQYRHRMVLHVAKELGMHAYSITATVERAVAAD